MPTHPWYPLRCTIVRTIKQFISSNIMRFAKFNFLLSWVFPTNKIVSYLANINLENSFLKHTRKSTDLANFYLILVSNLFDIKKSAHKWHSKEKLTVISIFTSIKLQCRRFKYMGRYPWKKKYSIKHTV